MKVADRPYTPEAAVVKPQTAAEVDFLVYLSGPGKIKPSTGSGRRERISVHHDELITGVDFFFAVQELLDIECVLGIIIGGVLVACAPQHTVSVSAFPILHSWATSPF